MKQRDRSQRFGKLVSQPDTVEEGQYVPWASKQKIGSVKEIKFDAESRKGFLTGFRKRKTERRTVAKNRIVEKEKAEKRKEKREKMRSLMDAFDDRQQKMKKLYEHGEDDVPEGSDAVDSDDSNDSDDIEKVDPPPENKKLKFGNRAEGTVSTVVVEEMDLSSFDRASVGASLLPALPLQENKPLGKKKRKQSAKGSSRQVKKDKLQKSKRERKKGGKAGGGKGK
mmetsp:Transcript_36824/g.73807  ORF Transcript_36824/g.73807 Transcript_36824/m.73807 type:complete len:225 (-) Transcript_36824:16-690(-)